MNQKTPLEQTVEQLRQLEHNLTNHAPANEYVVNRFEEIRRAAKDLGELIIHLTPHSREQSLALTNLEQTVMWAVAGIARNQHEIPEPGSEEEVA